MRFNEKYNTGRQYLGLEFGTVAAAGNRVGVHRCPPIK